MVPQPRAILVTGELRTALFYYYNFVSLVCHMWSFIFINNIDKIGGLSSPDEGECILMHISVKVMKSSIGWQADSVIYHYSIFAKANFPSLTKEPYKSQHAILWCLNILCRRQLYFLILIGGSSFFLLSRIVRRELIPKI